MRKIAVLLCLLVFANISAVAQSSEAAAYGSSITAADLQKHLSIVAGEAMEGRETGTEGQRKAAAYIESYYKSLGLPAVEKLKGHQQYYPLYKDSMLAAQFSVNGKEAVYGTDYMVPASTNNNGKFRSKKIVFAGYGIEDTKYSDYSADFSVRGKVVVIVLGEPKSADGNYMISGTKKSSEWTFPGLSKKLAIAAAKGVAGVLVINPSMETFSSRMVESGKKSNVYFPRGNNDSKFNYANISHAFAKNILGDTRFDSVMAMIKRNAAFGTLGFWKSRVSKTKMKFSYSKDRTTINASNVLGIIEGSDKKEEYLFITAHYDHLGKRDGKIFYGADDDGSGTVAVLEIAEAFTKAKAAGKGPRRTVICMAVSGEEKGLWGSEYYSDHPVFPLDKTTADLNIDMIGRIDTERKLADSNNYVYVVGHDKISSDLPLINEAQNNLHTGLILDYKFDNPNDPERIYFRSDHYNFARKGVPVLFFYDGMLKADYHKPTDTIEKINWALFEKRARMIFYTAWEMANRNEMLTRDKPVPTATR